VATGDDLILLESNSNSLFVSQVFSFFRVNRNDFDLMRAAIDDPFLAESCRKDIGKIIGAGGNAL
jgi:hypothetical protein